MRRPLSLLNLVLGVVAALIAAALARTWVAPVIPVPNPATTNPSQEAEALAYNPIARPPLAQFDVVLERNPFKQPPPMPVMPLQSAAPPPLPVLVGTILADSDRRAILSDKGKANIYSVGQAVAGGLIIEIREDRIIFKRGDTTQEIALKAAIQAPAAALPQGSEPAPSQVPAATSPVVPSPPPVGFNMPNPEEVRRRQEEIMQRGQEMRERHKGWQQGR